MVDIDHYLIFLYALSFRFWLQVQALLLRMVQHLSEKQ